MSKHMSEKPKPKKDFSDIDNLERATETFLQEQHKLLAARRPVRAPKSPVRSDIPAAIAGELRRRIRVANQIKRDKARLDKLASRQQEQASRKDSVPHISRPKLAGTAGVLLAGVLLVSGIAVFSGRKAQPDTLIPQPEPQTTAAIVEQTAPPAEAVTEPAETGQLTEETQQAETKQSAALRAKQTGTAGHADKQTPATTADSESKDDRSAGTNSAIPAQPASYYNEYAGYVSADQDDTADNENSVQMNGTRGYGQAQTITNTSATKKTTTTTTRPTTSATSRSTTASTSRVTSRATSRETVPPTTPSTTRKTTPSTTTTTTTTTRRTVLTQPPTSPPTTTTTTTTTAPPDPYLEVETFEVMSWEFYDEEQNIYKQHISLHIYNDSPTAMPANTVIPMRCDNSKGVQHVRFYGDFTDSGKGIAIDENVIYVPLTHYIRGWSYAFIEMEIISEDFVKGVSLQFN